MLGHHFWHEAVPDDVRSDFSWCKADAAHVQATGASAPVSPHEIMVKQGTSIPVEYFAHPF
jgi:hypothetical protein